MKRSLSVVFAVCLAIWASPAAAQEPSPGTVFVTGSGYGAIRWAPTNDDYGTTVGGAVPAGALGVGVHLTPRVSARVEWAMTGRLEDTAEVRGFPTEPFPFGSGILASWTLLPDGATAIGTSLPTSLSVLPVPTERRQTKAGFALLGYHLNAGRASIELLGGVGLVHERVTHITEAWLAIFPPQGGRRYETTYGRHSAVPVLGADAAVSLTSHLSLVPQVRAYVQEGSLNVWPGLGLRWTF